MKKLLPWIALFLPIAVMSAPTVFTVTWDPYPTTQNGQVVTNGVMNIQCRAGQNAFTQVGTSSLQGPANVTVNSNPGDKVECLAVATAPNFTSSPASGVGSTTVPLQVLIPPTGLKVQVAP